MAGPKVSFDHELFWGSTSARYYYTSCAWAIDNQRELQLESSTPWLTDSMNMCIYNYVVKMTSNGSKIMIKQAEYYSSMNIYFVSIIIETINATLF